MTLRRCQSCSLFYDKKLGVCPDCETPAYGFCKALAMGKVNGHLNDMLRSADRERRFERSLRSR